ncbi:MAG: NADH-quinone oxidoreductase subunit H [Butyrivibrio sp.]|nr:NADH-quinone oxidoreductase subunit H [Butyrivibrio sp.]
MAEWTIRLISIAAYLILAPLAGGLIAGLDRKITARMQGRKGPSILQPFYDLAKLFSKETLIVNKTQYVYIVCFFVTMMLTGGLFFGGFDILMVFLTLTTAAMFFVFAGASTNSPVATMGAQRELAQMLAYEPMILIVAVGIYIATGSFKISEVIFSDMPAIVKLPGIFIGFVAVLTIKFRKSPFDLSTSHHAHQELVMGVSTDMSGKMLGLVELTHWYENIILYGVVALFFVYNSLICIPVTIVGLLAVFLLEIFIDNICARVKASVMIKYAWGVTIVAGGINILVLEYFI